MVKKNFIVLIFDIQELLHKYKQKRKSSYVIEKIDRLDIIKKTADNNFIK